ncbi:hypothetical protein J6590_048469 [Homalodisca vitripennis]|nr:hypothetical protein J6590_048469 [Homalodisca vitripennis]
MQKRELAAFSRACKLDITYIDFAKAFDVLSMILRAKGTLDSLNWHLTLAPFGYIRCSVPFRLTVWFTFTLGTSNNWITGIGFINKVEKKEKKGIVN